VKVLAVVLIVTAIWLLLASLRDGRDRRRAAVDTNDVWLIEQHDSVVRLGQEAALPPGHPLARLSTAPTSRRG
jgi:hypothetical protein